VDAANILGQSPLFAALSEAERRRLAELAERQDLHSGQRLYGENESPAYFYIVVSGRLRVSVGGDLLGYVGRGEPVGEMGVITGEARTSSVHALRDSVLLRIASIPFLDLLHREAPTLMAVTRLMLGRLRQYQRSRRRASTRAQGALAVIPASASVPVQVLAEALVRRLGGWPGARLITATHVDAALGAGAAPDAVRRHGRLRASARVAQPARESPSLSRARRAQRSRYLGGALPAPGGPRARHGRGGRQTRADSCAGYASRRQAAGAAGTAAAAPRGRSVVLHAGMVRRRRRPRALLRASVV
jgi:CRP-like cAMP-binding protein